MNEKLIAVKLGHGRRLTPGQIWQSNDHRKLRAIRIVQFLDHGDDMIDVVVENIQTGKVSIIDTANFTVGQRGWSLLTRSVLDTFPSEGEPNVVEVQVRDDESHPITAYFQNPLRSV